MLNTTGKISIIEIQPYIYITIIIFCLPFFDTFSQWSKFECDGSDQCQGIKFSIKYPSNWKTIDGDQPHILQKFEFEDKQGYGQLIIYINKFEEIPDQSDDEAIYSKENVINSLGNVKKLLEFNDQAIIEDERCVYATTQIDSFQYILIMSYIMITEI